MIVLLLFSVAMLLITLLSYRAHHAQISNAQYEKICLQWEKMFMEQAEQLKTEKGLVDYLRYQLRLNIDINTAHHQANQQINRYLRCYQRSMN